MHRFKKHKNRIRDLSITETNQVFVVDITYLDTFNGFCYLALVTDVYSRKIVGYDVSRSLAIEGSLRALKMALKSVREPEKLIHHSDRGIQYCSHAYVDYLLERNITISMTEENHVYENAIAERVNGILKIEFMLGEKLLSVELAQALVAEAIQIYNEERPHLKLGYETPSKVYGNG
jgi:transposase InsO family protein